MLPVIAPRWWIALYGILIVFIVLAWLELSRLPDGKLHLHVLDVGQGDAILLVSPSGKQILVDGGPDLSVLEQLRKHMPFFDRTIELVVLTHPDADHGTGIPEVLRRYRAEKILFNGTEHDSGRYEAFLDEVLAQKLPVIFPDPAADIDLGDGLVLDQLWPLPSVFGSDPKHSNNESVVLRALFGSASVLLTGDIEESAENAILATGADIHADILKAPHHGSKTSSSTGFLLAVDPERVLISVAAQNSYGHPSLSVLDRYRHLDIPFRSTALEGTLSASTDGRTWLFP